MQVARRVRDGRASNCSTRLRLRWSRSAPDVSREIWMRRSCSQVANHRRCSAAQLPPVGLARRVCARVHQLCENRTEPHLASISQAYRRPEVIELPSRCIAMQEMTGRANGARRRSCSPTKPLARHLSLWHASKGPQCSCLSSSHEHCAQPMKLGRHSMLPACGGNSSWPPACITATCARRWAPANLQRVLGMTNHSCAQALENELHAKPCSTHTAR